MTQTAPEYDYDLIVIGSGPAGQKAAIQASKIRKRVAVVEIGHEVGGVCTNTGTIPSKSFREAVMFLTGFRERLMYGSSYRVKPHITMEDLTFRISSIVQHENQVIEDQLNRNGIDIIRGRAAFADPHRIVIHGEGIINSKSAEFFVIAVGTVPHHPPCFEIDEEKILDSDGVLHIKQLPRHLTVVGGGIIGIEYASWFSVLGVKVTLIEARTELLSFLDREIVECFKYHARELGMTIRVNEEVLGVNRRPDGLVETHLRGGEKILSDTVIVSAGRQGATDRLNLELIGLKADDYGRIKVNKHFQTEVPNIYAVGDVVGFPSLASTGMRQGRLAAAHAFNMPPEDHEAALPFGVWTIPEMAMVGETEDSLTKKSIPYETGVARYKEIARGVLNGDESGMLKLVFHRDTHEILGVHAMGEGAIEILHLGQAVLSFKGGLDYFTSGVFNYPTLTECYKVAALDGFNKISSC